MASSAYRITVQTSSLTMSTVRQSVSLSGCKFLLCHNIYTSNYTYAYSICLLGFCEWVNNLIDDQTNQSISFVWPFTFRPKQLTNFTLSDAQCVSFRVCVSLYVCVFVPLCMFVSLYLSMCICLPMYSVS